MTTKKTQSAISRQESVIELNSAPAPQPAVSATTALSAIGVPSISGGSREAASSTMNRALVAAQAECKNAIHNKHNSHFKSTYADLAAVRESVVPVFNKHGFAIIQGTNIDEFMGFHLETRVIHESGEQMVFRFPLPPDVSRVQQVGSVITYARRYSYAAIAGIVAEEDLDGNETLQAANGGGRSPGAKSAGGRPHAGASEDGGTFL